MPKLSVIVPIYNAEKYLSRCIESILCQDYSDIEVLLANDGSTDSSGDICEIYADKDSRIKVLHKENGGVSSARNLGLDNAKGEYITFVDADDWLENDTITPETFDGDYDVIRIPCNHSSNKKSYEEEITLRNHRECYNFLLTDFCNACWGRIYKKSVIGLTRFDPKIKMGEDILFFIDIIPKITSFHIIPGQIGYHYYSNDHSATHTLGLIADQELLIKALLVRAKKQKDIAWSVLRKTCYINCRRFHCLSLFYGSFSFIEILLAPIDRDWKYTFLKSKVKCILHYKEKEIDY